MPIYEYKCENGHVFEVIQKFSDEALTECEVCGAPAVRVLTPPAIHFKGSGFHNTDYGKRSAGNSGSGKGDGGESSGSGDSSSGDSSGSSDSGSSDSKSSGSGDKAKASTAD